MTLNPLSFEELPGRLAQIKNRVSAWLPQRQTPGQSFGHFQLCPHAEAADELNAATGALELWVMLGLPMSAEHHRQAVAHLLSFQNPLTGLVVDPSWAARQVSPNPSQLSEGDTFFTMTTTAALRALGAGFTIPARYLADTPPGELLTRTDLAGGCHNPFTVGDYGGLIQTHIRLGVPGAVEQWKAINRHMQVHQDGETGFWPAGQTERRTPSVNRAFHLLRSTWNQEEGWMRCPELLIDSCLAASEDPEFYSWQKGYACNDLDLAHVIYSARCASAYRKDEVAVWAQARLPMMLSVQKPDGGFSFFHEAAMIEHAGLRMSPGAAESDTWGTLMYLGTIKMMVELGYAGQTAPWAFSYAHRVPNNGLLQ